MGSPGPLAPPERPLEAEWAPKQSASSVRGKGQANHRPKNLAALCRFRSFQRYAILNPESSRWPDFHFLSSNPLLGAGGKCVPALPCPASPGKQTPSLSVPPPEAPQGQYLAGTWCAGPGHAARPAVMHSSTHSCARTHGGTTLSHRPTCGTRVRSRTHGADHA